MYFLIQAIICIITQVTELLKKKQKNQKQVFTVSLSYRFQEIKGNLVAGFTVRVLCKRWKVRTGEKMQILEGNQICTTKQNKN